MLAEPLAVPADRPVYVSDPTWIPHDYDARTDSLTFARVNGDSRDQAVFLDRRFLGQAPKSPPVRIGQLSRAEVASAAGPIHFIFHTAFCCSTLMTRALSVPRVSAGLKEPGVLVSFAQHWSNARQTPGALNALGVTLDLLSRPMAPGETQIVKASNVATHLLPDVLHLRPDAKVLVMYSDLGGFLEAVTRRDINGRSFARQTYQGFANSIPLDIALTADDRMLLTDTQVAAFVWLMQAAFFTDMQRHYGPARIRTLSSDRFLSDPASALRKAGAFFGLHADRTKWDAIAVGPIFTEHAKERGLSFTVRDHNAQLAQARSVHARELAATEDWSKRIAARCGAPLSLNDTLMDEE
ncbi:MAG: hypothetical protein R3C31_09370 [Hyphomonadaceae bacterium]